MALSSTRGSLGPLGPGVVGALPPGLSRPRLLCLARARLGPRLPIWVFLSGFGSKQKWLLSRQGPLIRPAQKCRYRGR